MKYLLLLGNLLAGCSALKPPSAAQLITKQQAVSHTMAVRPVGIHDAPSIIRKDNPLVFIDGRKCSAAKLQRLAPKSIDSVRIIIPAVSTAIYGKGGRDGVVVFTTKKKLHE